jgi:hypothetical protein
LAVQSPPASSRYCQGLDGETTPGEEVGKLPYDSPDVNLGDLLKQLASGKTQLPDFQREWKWDTDMIRSLLASISLEHPVGVLMMLETGEDSVRFLPKPISGVTLPAPTVPEFLILDGQQRLTSLYQSLYSGKSVDTKDPRGKKLMRWYYLDINRALNPEEDREEAIIGVPEDRIVRTFRGEVEADYSTMQNECAAEVFPLSRVFDAASIFAWQNAYLALDPDRIGQRSDRWIELYEQVLQNFIAYTVPVIILKKETPKEAVCTVFEKVNTAGIALNVFELLTATFAVEGFRLNDDWKLRKERLSQHPVLRSLESTDLLQAVALLTTWDRRREYLGAGSDPAQAPGISCKRREILRLSLSDYQRWAERVTEAFFWVASFLADEHIFQASDVPYKTQLVPLAAIRVAVGPAEPTHGVVEKLRQWYWCGVLGELYGGTTETRFARDLADIVDWIEGGPMPATIGEEATFNPARLLTLRTRNSAAYKGVYALLMRNDAVDWMVRQSIDLASFFNHKLDIHHVFPKKWCNDNGIDQGRRESIVNKTPLSFSTNRRIGGRAPSVYLPIVERAAELEPERLDDIVRTHSIEPTYLRNDDFESFFAGRSEALIALIAAAMGKEVYREPSGAEEAGVFEEEPLEPDDEDLFALIQEQA